jgi:RNA polymerase sigma-70 factor (ECF subfamily)
MSAAGNAEDLRDIAESLQGDRRAYGRLVQRYQQQIANQMWRFTRDPDELEDLVHEVFVEAFLSLSGYRGDAPFLHWLRRIATRTGYRYWKRCSRERERRRPLSDWAASATAPPPDPGPSEAAEVLHRLLEQLGPKDRLVLTLQYFEECSTKEIAERTGWSLSLVKVRAHRARNRLKRILIDAGYTEEALR